VIRSFDHIIRHKIHNQRIMIMNFDDCFLLVCYDDCHKVPYTKSRLERAYTGAHGSIGVF
jgi:hypothetical protein